MKLFHAFSYFFVVFYVKGLSQITITFSNACFAKAIGENTSVYVCRRSIIPAFFTDLRNPTRAISISKFSTVV